MDTLYSDLKKFGRVKINEPLSKHTTFKIGGPARLFVTVEETEKIVKILDFLSASGVNYFIIGGGSNLLISDGEYDGVVVKIASKNQPKLINQKQGAIIEAEAGVVLGSLVNLACKNSLTGLEWAIGIPGTVGGAVRGNAGAMGKDISLNLESVKIWRDGEVLELENKDCEFAYRESMFKNNNDVVLSTQLYLEPGKKEEIIGLTQKYMKLRSSRTPPFPSAGSFFKNLKLDQWSGNVAELPELFRERGSVPAGWLIEQVQGKGENVGGAKISDEHGNFIVNFDNAKQEDVLNLVEEVKGKVYNKFKIELEPEVEILTY